MHCAFSQFFHGMEKKQERRMSSTAPPSLIKALMSCNLYHVFIMPEFQKRIKVWAELDYNTTNRFDSMQKLHSSVKLAIFLDLPSLFISIAFEKNQH